jgi:hypothetical protein
VPASFTHKKEASAMLTQLTIVGNVQQGGGANKKEKEQPDAKAITHAPQPAMRREDTQREPVPIARDAKR